MAIAKKIERYLQKNKIKFEIIKHRTVYTAYDLAATLKEKLERIGKTLLVKADDRHVLVVLPANRRLDVARLKKHLGAKRITIASEKDMVKTLKVKPGALTPFGALHKLEVVVDKAMAKATDFFVGAGSFTESLRLKVKDFLRLVDHQQANISTKASLPPTETKKRR